MQLSTTPCRDRCSPVIIVERDGEHGEECVKWLSSDMPSSTRRDRHGSDTDAGIQSHDRSWSATTKRMFGRAARSAMGGGALARGRDQLLRPRIVGLAARRANDLIDEMELAG